MEASERVRELVRTDPNRHQIWTLQSLAHAAGLSLTDTKVAVECLIMRGELVRKSGEHYALPHRKEP